MRLHSPSERPIQPYKPTRQAGCWRFATPPCLPAHERHASDLTEAAVRPSCASGRGPFGAGVDEAPGALLSAIARADDTPLGVNGADAATPLVQQMAGTWDVRQRMWPGAAAKAIDLPPAVAHRVLIGSAILQEVMTVASESSRSLAAY
jgi:hypothetical protein